MAHLHQARKPYALTPEEKATGKVPHEDALVENFRYHLRNARKQGITGKLIFTMANGGVASKSTKLLVEYEYLDNTDQSS